MTSPVSRTATDRAPVCGRALAALSVGLCLGLPLALAATPVLPAGAANRTQLHKKAHHKAKPRHKAPKRPTGNKLPKELTSSTGNFFTLEAYDPPTTAAPVANVLVKVCTSPNTPADTAIEPAFFTLATAGTAAVPESPSSKSPQLTPMPLRPSQCDSGWMAFSDAGGAKVLSLTYNYGTKLVWTLG